ncbi:MAG: lysylphosphatidylglycerol synthase transmembrane domain-containing protein [Anaerolineae bacterium]|jgi:uncharacterized membrane protein YbhN (UPF0104 family)
MRLLKQHWRNLLRIVISLGALTCILLTVGLEEIADLIRQANLGFMLAAFALFVVGTVIRAVRWMALLRALEIQVPLRRLVELYFVGTFFNLLLPSGFGGDAVRVLELTQDTHVTAALGTVIVDRMTGLLVLFAMALAVLPFSGGLLPTETALSIGLLAVAGLVAGGLVLQGELLRRWGHWLPGPLALDGEGALARTLRAVNDCGPRAIAQALGMSLLFNLLLVNVNYLAARAVGVDIDLAYFLLFVPVLSITLMLPISIGGLGVREGMAIFLFDQAGVGQAAAVAASLGVYVVSTLLTGLLGGLIYLAQGTLGLRTREAPTPIRTTDFTDYTD